MLRLPLLLGSFSFIAALPLFVGRAPAEVEPTVELRRVLAGEGASVPSPEQLRESWSADPARAADDEARLDAGTVDLVASVQGGEWAHVELLAALQDPAFVGDERLACAELYATDVQTACSYRLEMLIDRRDEGYGEIMTARAMIHERHLTDDELTDEGCDDFAMCLAGIRVGQSVPIPQTESDTLAVSQELYSPWADPRLFDPEYVKELTTLYRQRVDSYGSEPTFESPMQRVNYQFAANLIPYLRDRAARLQEAEG